MIRVYINKRNGEKMKRVAIVINDLSYGGAQTMLLELVRNINLKKYKIKVFVLYERQNSGIEKEFDNSGVDCQYLSINKSKGFFSKIMAIITCLKEISMFKPDIVHGHLDTFYAPLYCLLKKKPFIFTVHSFPNRILHSKFRFLLKKLREKRLLRIVGCAQCVTDAMVKELGESFKDTGVTIYNPIVVSKYQCDNSLRNSCKFVHVGRMESIKNQMLILESFERLHKIHNNLKLIMVGDGPLKNNYIEYTKKQSLEDCIEFLGNRADINCILAKCDYFVLSSNSECCPMSILEAMASGLPIISTDVGGIREVINDAGILYSVGSKDELFSAMKTLYENPSLRNAMKKKAQKIIRDFDVKYIAPKYEKEYDLML